MRCRRRPTAVDVLHDALLLIGCRCAIEHEGLWQAQFQTFGDANPGWLRETSFLSSGEVPEPQTHTPRHGTKTCPLNSPYAAPTLSLGSEQLYRMEFGDENETSRSGSGRRTPLLHDMRACACIGTRPGRSCMQRRIPEWEDSVLPARSARGKLVSAGTRGARMVECSDRSQ